MRSYLYLHSSSRRFLSISSLSPTLPSITSSSRLFSTLEEKGKGEEFQHLDGDVKWKFLNDLSTQQQEEEGGVTFVSQLSLPSSLQLRSELLQYLKKSSSSSPLKSLEKLNLLLRKHLEDCCSKDEEFRLERILPSNSNQSLLQIISRTEAVHPFSKTNWKQELEFRTTGPRHIYALFHSSLPNSEPVAFISVFLSNHLVGNMREILPNASSPSSSSSISPTSAIFYSINLAQSALQGVNVAARLIKTLLAHLLKEQQTIKTFATLSPLPSFLSWLQRPNYQLPTDPVCTNNSISSILEALKSPNGYENKEVILRLVANHILHGPGGCPVANFHLRNGARVEQLNWLADTSELRLKQSGGVMVNYLYDPQLLSQHSTSYLQHKLLPVSPSLQLYFQPPPSSSSSSFPSPSSSFPPSVYYPIQR